MVINMASYKKWSLPKCQFHLEKNFPHGGDKPSENDTDFEATKNRASKMVVMVATNMELRYHLVTLAKCQFHLTNQHKLGS